MATTKVSALAETTSPQANDELLINQSGVSKKVKITNLPAGTPGTGSISTAMLADDAVTADKLANSINAEITANTAKTGITSGQASAIVANTAKTGITSTQADAIVANTAKTGITSSQASAIVANTAKTGITSGQASAITANTAKVTNATHTGDVTGATALTIGNNKVVTAMILDDNVTAAKLANSINTDIATGVTANTTANAALPKTGGIITGGEVDFNDNIKARFGTGKDLNIYHDGLNSYVEDASVGDLILKTDGAAIKLLGGTDTMAKGTKDGAFGIYHDNNIKLATTSTGVTVTGGAVGTMTTDNDGSFAMSASNNFKCTPAGNFALTFTAIVAQSGNILFINSGGHTISAHANTKVDANLLATISTAGTYLLSYFSDGTNVYMTNSAVYT